MAEKEKVGAFSGVQSIERAFDIIEAVAVYRDGVSLTNLSEAVGLHKSTVHRIVATLLSRKYLEKTADGNYKIGLKLIEIVSFYMNSLELQTEARPYVAQITTHLGLTAHLGVLDGDQVVYVEQMNVVSTMRLYSQIGVRMHAYCSSLGKCLLSRYSHTELRDVMKDCSFIRFTPNTVCSLEQLEKELALVRKRGWALDNEEYEKGHRCIGAPIYDYRGEIIAAISASGDKRVLTDDRIEEVAKYVMKAAQDLSREMGYVE